MKKLRSLAVLNLLALIVHISLSYGTQLKLINSKGVGEVSDRYTSLFTPAGITFAIWGIIYIALLVFCIYHLIKAYRHGLEDSANIDLQKIGPWFILNNLGAAAWLVVWTNEMISVSVALIFFQLITLIIIHLRTGIYNPRKSVGDLLCTDFPLSIYFAWLSIASIANTSVYLVADNWNGWGITAVNWTIIMISVAVLLTVIVILSRRNAFYGLVVIWALYGIIIKRQQVDPPMYASVINIAWIGIAIVALVSVIQFIRSAVYHKGVHRMGDKTFPMAQHSLK